MTEQRVEELIQKYADGTASKEEIQKLMHWYQSADIGEVKWPSSDESEKSTVQHRMFDRLQQAIAPKKARLINLPWLRVAAMLAVFLGAGFMTLYIFKPDAASFITVINPSGKIQLASLPDGSKVWLNASTSLRYKKSFNDNREVILDGEAYFDVTHDAKHPFKVEAGGITTTVLGTSFNIKALKAQSLTSVSLITGRVQVSNTSRELGVLTPSMQLQFNRLDQTAKTVRIDTNAVLAWKKGSLQFQGETFEDIASSIENWYGIKIIFANPGMRSCRYYMNFESSISLENLLSTMSQITEMTFVINANGRIVTLSGKECR